MSHLVTSLRMEEGKGEIWPCFCFYPIVSGDLAKGRRQSRRSQLLMRYPEAWKSLDLTT